MAGSKQGSGVDIKLGTFGFKVDIYTAIEGSKAASLNNICIGADEDHRHAPSRVRQLPLECPVCENTAVTDTFTKGKDMGSGKGFVIVPPEVIDNSAEGIVKGVVDIKAHPADQIGAMFSGGKNYALMPSDAGSAETYALVAAAIQSRPNLSFVCTWAARTAMAMYQIKVLDGGVLAMSELAWPGSVNALPVVPTVYREEFMPIAQTLIDAVTSDYDPLTYVDGKSKVILEYITNATAVAGADVGEDTPVGTPVGPIDLMAQLQAAVSAATSDKAPVQEMPSDPPANVSRLGAAATKAGPKKKAVKKLAAVAEAS